MSSTPYFYLPCTEWNTEVLLTGQEATHLHQVLRAKIGTEVTLLDGEGRTGTFVVKNLTHKGVELTQLTHEVHPRPQTLPIIALALSKAVRRSFFMEKAVELGAAGIWLWQGDQSQGKINTAMAEALRRQTIAGAKQCHNPWLPEIKLFTSGLKELLNVATDIEQRILPWELQDTEHMLQVNDLGRPGKTLYIIGPEGGFSNQELDLLEQEHFKKVSLGHRILRCETAAVLCLGLHFWASHLNSKA